MSQIQDQDVYFTFDRDIFNQTPPLEEIRPTLRQESPTLDVRLDNSCNPRDAGDPSDIRQSKKEEDIAFANDVLLRSLAPNEIQLASHAEGIPLDRASESQTEDEGNEAVTGAGQQQISEVVQPQTAQNVVMTRKIAAANAAWENLLHVPPIFSDGTCRLSHREQVAAIIPEHPSKEQPDNFLPPFKDALELSLKPSHGYQEKDEDCIVMSTSLAKFVVAREHAPPDCILPALQQQPAPESSPADSPEPKPNLPNFKMLMGALWDAGVSPKRQAQLADFTSFSIESPRMPTGSPSRYAWRATARDSGTPKSTSHTSSSATASTPSPSSARPSAAASHASSRARVPEQDEGRQRQESLEEIESCQSDSQHGAAPAVSLCSSLSAVSSHRCTHPKCTAPVFKTAYLLSSHMNVHSNFRDYFCPVKGCPRGPGGEGFKRENEMRRHGLVHTSPGYTCPFCPDQAHKYPRPDNLQRYVRLHHEERIRNDPALREVLNQGLEGRRSGRRRMRL